MFCLKAQWPELQSGAKARVTAAVDHETDFVMSAIVGVAGLEATFEGIRAGKRIGLANKEVLVASGKLVMAAAKAHGVDFFRSIANIMGRINAFEEDDGRR